MFKFGASNAANTATPAAAVAAPQTNMFGQQQSGTQSSGSSLFGNKKPAFGTSGSLFSNNAAQPQSTPLFNSTTNQQPQTSSLFGNNQQQQQQQQQPSIAQTAASIPMNKPIIELQKDTKDKKKTALNDLLDAAKNLPSITDSFDALSNIGTSELLGDSVQLSLDELSRRAKNLSSRTKTAKDMTRAHYLLAGSGLDIQEAEHTLSNLSTACKSRDLYQHKSRNAHSTHHHWEKNRFRQPISSTDLDSYLKSKKDENILLSIEQSLNSAAKDFDSFVSSNFTLESWEKRKQEVRESFGILMKKRKLNGNTTEDVTQVTDGLSFSSNSWVSQNKGILSKILETSKLNVNENSLVREKFEKYGKIVHKFNNFRQNQNNESLESFGLCERIIDDVLLNGVEPSSLNEENNRIVIERFNILQSISRNGNVTENSRKYLENQFLKYVDELYSKKLKNEGLPSTVNKIQSFVQFKLKSATSNQWRDKKLTIVNNVPIWALIYYLLRAGCTEEALQVAIENKNSFKKVESSFLTYLKHYCTTKDNELPLEFQSRIHTEYNQHLKNAVDGDPYRLAVYKIIGKCDLSNKTISGVVNSVEDWMWFHLSLITNSTSDVGSSDLLEHYSLKDFQNTVIAYGASHFGSNIYIQILLLSGLYNSLVKYILIESKIVNEIDSFHLLFCLHIFNKLDVPELQKFITVEKLFTTYIHSFIKSDPKLAVEYILLLPIHGDKHLIETCHTLIRELVLTTKEFSVLLGRINSVDGTRIPGVLEERYQLMFIEDKTQFLHTITERAARKADEDGRIDDSLLLYQLSEEYDIVFSIVNKSLSDLLSGFDYLQKKQLQDMLWDETDDTNVILLASRLANLYLKQNNNLEISSKIGSKKKEAMLTLLKIVDIWRLYTNSEYSNCLDMINNLNILPIFSTESVVRRGIASGPMINNETNEIVVKNIPNLLILTMTCISNLVKSTNMSSFQTEENKTQFIDQLKRIAKNCMTYVGMTYYKMSRETYSILLNIESEL